MIDIDSIRSSFEALVTDSSVSLPVQYENVPDSPSVESAKTGNNSWVRIAVREGAGSTISCGGSILRRYPGMVIVSLFYPKEAGTSSMRQKSSHIANILLTASITSTYVRTPIFEIIGDTEDWFQGNLTVPFEADQVTY